MSGGLELIIAAAVILGVATSFFVSSSAGLGGSLILVPTMTLLLGTKEGIALSALLLASNNVVKLCAYRTVLPLRKVAPLVAMTMLGSFLGARLLIAVPARAVAVAVIGAFAATFLAERRQLDLVPRFFAPILALASGTTSGFSGTSGPLKGVAIRSLRLDRLHTVGAAALASTFGDVTKAAVFTKAGLLSSSSYWIPAMAVPLMIVSTLAGRRFNSVIGEQGYERLFWGVMTGYTARLIFAF